MRAIQMFLICEQYLPQNFFMCVDLLWIGVGGTF